MRGLSPVRLRPRMDCIKRRGGTMANRTRVDGAPSWRSRIILALCVAGSLFVLGLGLASQGPGGAHAGGSVLIAIDADPGTSGTQDCIGNVTVGSDVSFDLLIENVPDIEGYGLRFLYDNSVLSVISKDRSVSMLGTSGFDLGDPLPGTSNSYLNGFLGTATSGSGILSRYTVHAEAAGLTRVHLVPGVADTNYVDSISITHLPDSTQDAFVSVGAPCPDSTSDRDSDGVKDFGADGTAFTSDDDNCPSAPNAGQENRDGDTLGNACDPVVMTIDADTVARKEQSCRGFVTSGSAIDLIIRNANVEGFQARIAYDNSIMSFASRDKTASVLGASGLEAGSSFPESSSRLFHAYTGTGVVVPNGGVLMRYTVNAGSNGLTRLHLINGPLDSFWVDTGLNSGAADQTPDAFLEVGGACPSPTDDRDSDGFTDFADACPNVFDDQADLDSDVIGDACDADDENDSVLDANDNCPRTANASQADNDGDGQPGVQPGANDTFGGDTCDPDDDNDGIDDGIDGPGQSFTFSDDFSDGTTSGSIVDRNGLAVRVRDEAGPSGVRIKATGAGGPATVSACSSLTTLTFNANNEAVVTCGSATVQVVSGPVTTQIGSFLRGTLPSSTTTTITRAGAVTTVCNSAASSTSIVFTGIAIPPNSCRTDSDTDGFFDPTEVIMGTDPDVACGVGAWPPNLDDSGDNTVDIFDVGPLKAAFGASPGNIAYNARVDLNAESPTSTTINIADVSILKRFFGQLCSA